MIRRLMVRTAPGAETAAERLARKADRHCPECHGRRRLKFCVHVRDAQAVVGNARAQLAERLYRDRVAESLERARGFELNLPVPHVCGACVHCKRPRESCTCGQRFATCACEAGGQS